MRAVVRRVVVPVLLLALAGSLQVWGASTPTIKVMIADTTASQRTASKYDEVNNPYTDYIFSKTGVRVALEWQAGEGDSYNEKVTLALASGSAPDLILMGGNDQFCMNIARSGALEQLTPYLAKYPNLTRVFNDAYWKEYGLDGKRFVLKGATINPLAGRAILIRQDWLTKLGLKMPTTIAELRSVAAKFVAAKLDGQPVVGTTGRGNFTYFYSLSSAFGCPSVDVQMGYWYIDKATKKLVFWNTTNAARAYFKEALRWTKEGLLDPELLTSGGGAFWDKVNAGRVGIFCHRAESVGWVTTSIRQAQLSKTPVLGVVPALKGTGFKNPYGKEGGFEEDYAFEGYLGIPKGNKNIDNVLKVLDFECTPEFADFRVFGLEGIEHKVVAGKKVFDKANADLVSFSTDYCFTVDRNALSADAKQAILVNMSGGGDTSNDFKYDTLEEAVARTKAGWDAAALQSVPRQLFDSGIPKLPVQSLYPDVRGPYLSLYVKLITGELDAGKDADWQTYLKGVDAAGITAITKAKEDYLLRSSPALFQ